MARLLLFTLACSAFAAALAASFSGAALAAECGKDPPDYAATRTITVNGNSVVLRVFVSRYGTREEHNYEGKKMVVLRLPEQQVSYAFDPDSKRGVRLLSVPAKHKDNTRVVDDTDRDGATVRHLQIVSDNKWVDVLTTRCTSVGVMLHQTFTSIDPSGHLVTGELNQTEIKIGPLPISLFHLPGDITIR